MPISIKYTEKDREIEIVINNNNSLHINQMWEDLIKPLLLAIGYHPDNVNELIGEYNKMEK